MAENIYTTNTQIDGKSGREYNASLASNPTLPTGTQYNPVMQTAKQGELIDQQAVNPYGQQANYYGNQQAQQADQFGNQQASTYDATKIGQNTPQGQAAQGQLSSGAQVTAAQGEVSQQFNDYVNQASQGIADVELDERATVQHQYKQLMDGDMAWAQGAIRQANAALAQRGMGSSSIAGEAIGMAVLQAAMPIAQQDANAFRGLQMKKMDQRQALTMLKAGHLAEMDMANLNNRQQAAVMNAQHFLQMDMANLQNEQQMSVLNTQHRVQTLLSDQAADNAAKQFNATSQNQIDQFFANLDAQIRAHNTSQINEMKKFNAGEYNAQQRFNSQLADARERFNVENYHQIQQANAQYLREINTRNTAAINEANYINAQNLLQISNTALANEIQFVRDEMAYTFEASQNQMNRMENRALMVLNRDLALQLMDEKQKAALGQSVGSFATSALVGIADNWDTITGWFD